MAKARTPESDVPLTERFKRLTSWSRRDIALPMPPGGRRDPRLPASSTGVHRSLSEATKGLKTVRELGRKR
jgi:hypothetical protein